MKIINKPTATYKQCEEWIKSKKTANKLALENLPIMWDCAIKNGIDPVVLIAQSMKETGWYNFGGVVPASFHNPCGLKITKGGGDYEVGAHMRFESWEDGIMAQSDHLALYAGGPTVPKYSPECASHQNADHMDNGTTKDPRHFTYLFGKCPTVESLGCNWAPSASYGTDIVKMIKEVQAIKVIEPDPPKEQKPEAPKEPGEILEPVKPQSSKQENPLKEPVKPSIKPAIKLKKPIVKEQETNLQKNLKKGLDNFKKNIKSFKKKNK